jgi:GTP-binding protein
MPTSTDSSTSEPSQNSPTSKRLPVVAVVGRPNVGKSTLVNRIIGSRKAIVDDMPGVTRDRAYFDVDWQGKPFKLIDTGGLMPISEKQAKNQEQSHPFTLHINEQVQIAVNEADFIFFIVDGQAGITADDEAVAKEIRKAKKTVWLVVNKIDEPRQQNLIHEFHALGLGEPHPLSAMHGNIGVGHLLDKLTTAFGEWTAPEQATAPIRLAIVGRPNVGKSSILNGLTGENRMIVSNVSGTTRDAIDTPFTYKNQDYILVDTAGIRRKSKVDYGVELFSVDRSVRAIRESNVSIVVLDASEDTKSGLQSFITDQDKKIIETTNEEGKGLVLVVNKWDLIPDKSTTTTNQFTKKMYQEVPSIRHAPVVYTSAVKGQRLTKILETANTVFENCNRRISTSLINQVIQEAVAMSPPPILKSRPLKVLYATQVSVAPPTILLFVNDAKLMKDPYKRYLENKLRERFEWSGTPIVIIPRTRGDKE